MMGKEFGTIIQLGDILVSEEVVSEFFCCDYSLCKGICCVKGDSGAPLEEDEPGRIEDEYDSYSALMTEQGRKAVDAKGFFEIDIQNDIVTPLVPGTEECAYCHFGPGGECLCSIEKKWFEGKTRFRKPKSCHLYPIRVTRLTGGGRALNLHRWDICKDAYEKGRKEKIRVYEFLREPLIEYFGADFYEGLCAAAVHINGQDSSPERNLYSSP